MAEKNLKIDQDALAAAKKAYATCSTDMTKVKTTLSTAVQNLRTGWQSDAGTAFFDKFDNEWLKNFDDYIAVIDHMSDNMDICNTKYQAVFDEADKLGIF